MDEYVVLYIAGAALVLFILVFLIRSLFRIDTRVKHQQAMLDIIIEMARKQGVSSEDIDKIKNKYFPPQD